MSYNEVSGHLSMALDHTRNAVYARAIEQFVRPDSVVLDAGAGLGVLGIAAAKAGARKVYLIEPSPVAHLAQEIARSNGVADKVVVLRGRIEDVTLPEKVDLITSVFTGNSLFSEDLLPSLFRARDKWLQPGGALIPDHAELKLAPVCAPRFFSESVLPWSKPSIGVDLSAAQRFALNEVYGERQRDPPMSVLAAPAVIVSLDLHAASQANCETETTFLVTEGGDCHALCAWINIRLGDTWLSTGPEDPAVHWTPQLFPLNPPMRLEAGEHLRVTLNRPVYGDWTWMVRNGKDERRHSDFLARPMSIADMRKRAGSSTPTLNSKGAAALWLLENMRGSASLSDMAQTLMTNYPSVFASTAEAMAFVQRIARNYAD